MAEEPQTTPPTSPAPTEPLGNAPTARNPDGSLKDTQAATPTPSPPAEPPKPEPKAPPRAEGGAPEKYEAFKAPEGYEFDQALLDKATALCKDLNLPQEAAQRVVDLFSEASLTAGEAPYKMFEDLRKGWSDSIIKDPALGNGRDGIKPEIKASIGRLFDSLPADVGKDLREALDLTGAGDNPAFVKAFYNLAKQLGEGTLVTGRGPAPAGQTNRPAPPSAAQALYPNLPSTAH